MRVIRKVKLDKPNEFGRTLELGQEASGFIVNYEIDDKSRRSDESGAMVKRFKRRFHCAPDAVTGDKGFYSKGNVAKLLRAGGQACRHCKSRMLDGAREETSAQKMVQRISAFPPGHRVLH